MIGHKILFFLPFLAVALLDLSLLVRYSLRRDDVEGHGNGPVSVIVPAHNAEGTIADTLSSILDGELPECEVIVVDDGSTDGTLERCEGVGDNRLVLFQQGHMGKWAALNAGVAAARHERIVTIDADTVVEKTSISSIASMLERCDAVAGNLQVVAPMSFLEAIQAQEHLRISMHRRADGAVSTISGPFAAFKKSVLVDHPFIESPVEDFEHTARIVGDGARICYAPRSKAYTHMHGSFKKYISQRTRWTRGTIGEMKRRKMSFWGLCRGYIIATLDMLTVPLAVLSGQYAVLFALFALEGVVQSVGGKREGTGVSIGTLLFFPQLLFLAAAFLVLNAHAHIKTALNSAT